MNCMHTLAPLSHSSHAIPVHVICVRRRPYLTWVNGLYDSFRCVQIQETKKGSQMVVDFHLNVACDAARFHLTVWLQGACQAFRWPELVKRPRCSSFPPTRNDRAALR